MLVEKRRGIRQERLERFRRTGRVVALASDEDASSLTSMRSSAVSETADRFAPPSRSKKIFDGLLLAVEVAALVGLVFVLYNGLQVMRNLNQEAASLMVQPTLTPTPIIVAVVLPSGHTPPDSSGGTRLNEAEIPEHLRPLFQSLQNVPLPTPGPQHASRIQVPAINVDAPVVQGDGWEQLKKGVGQHLGSANPGDDRNIVLTAHNDVFGEIFRDLDQLKPGDQVLIHTSQKVFTYVVTGTRIVEPDEVSVMDSGSEAIVTLISCYPYMVDKQRIVVTARLESEN
jgi:sortase A